MITSTSLFDYATNLEDDVLTSILCMEDAGWAVRSITPCFGQVFVVFERERE